MIDDEKLEGQFNNFTVSSNRINQDKAVSFNFESKEESTQDGLGYLIIDSLVKTGLNDIEIKEQLEIDKDNLLVDFIIKLNKGQQCGLIKTFLNQISILLFL